MRMLSEGFLSVSVPLTKANQGIIYAIIGRLFVRHQLTSFCKALISASETGSGRVYWLESTRCIGGIELLKLIAI